MILKIIVKLSGMGVKVMSVGRRQNCYEGKSRHLNMLSDDSVNVLIVQITGAGKSSV